MRQINNFIGQCLNHFCNSKYNEQRIEWKPLADDDQDRNSTKRPSYGGSNILNAETIAISTITTTSWIEDNSQKNKMIDKSLISLTLRSQWKQLTLLDHRILRDLVIFIMNSKLSQDIRLKKLQIEMLNTSNQFRIRWLHPILSYSIILERIILSNNSLNDECVELICDALYFNYNSNGYDKLTSIDLSNNKDITDVSIVKYFIPMVLDTFNNLRVFNLSATSIGDKSLNAMIQLWTKKKNSKDKPWMQRLTIIKLKNNQKITEKCKTDFENKIKKLFDSEKVSVFAKYHWI